MQSTLNHLLLRTARIRRLLEKERTVTDPRPSRRLRLQALLLRAQQRLAGHLMAISTRGPAPVGG
ncbi:MAG: hypothetical protein KGP27_07565 [Hyphomicrobiales bacterium]|nr:hypothetical protein [Hyphomicrobiales bacterium]